MNPRKLLVLIALGLVAGLFLALDVDQYLTLDALRARQAELHGAVAEWPLATAGVFFLGYVVMAAASLPGAAIMTVAAGALFGLFWGTVISSFASTIGALLAFWTARYLLRDAVGRRFSNFVEAIDRGIEREGEFYLFGLRLVPLFPYFAVNVVMGLTAMRTWPFYWISQLGMIPGTIVYVNAGTQLAGVAELRDVLSPGLLGSFGALGVFPLCARWGLDWLARRKALRGHRRPDEFDANLVVIGAGSGGLVAAYLAATLKAKVVLVERERMGGDCLNTGCVPSKTLLRSAQLAALFRRAREFGLEVADPRVDFASVIARVRGTIETIAPHDSVERYSALGVECVSGEARILGPYQVDVDGRQITTRAIIIATGAHPVIPELPGLSDAPYLTSTTLWDLGELPKRLVILGGGPLGCEMAQAFARLGACVTIVTNAPQLLPNEDADAAELIAACFAAESIDVRTGHTATAVERTPEGEWVLRTASDGGEARIPFDRLLLAVGRRPSTSGLCNSDLGLRLGADGAVMVDDCLRTSIPTVYAVGDVLARHQFTHAASHEAYHATMNALFGRFWRSRIDYSCLPWATFTDPELARVGLNESDAKRRAIPYEVSVFGFDGSDRARAEGSAQGWVKVLTRPGSDRLLGATIIGPHAGELIAEFALAMTNGLGLSRILATIHVYPTLAEVNKGVAGVWRRTHVPVRAMSWLARYQRWLLGGSR